MPVLGVHCNANKNPNLLNVISLEWLVQSWWCPRCRGGSSGIYLTKYEGYLGSNPSSILLYLLFVLIQGMIIKSGYALKQVLPNMDL